MTYELKSKTYPEYSVVVNAPLVYAYGVAMAVSKQERIDIDITNELGVVVQSIKRD